MTVRRKVIAELRVRRGEHLVLPAEASEAEVQIGRRKVRLTNLGKTFFPEAGFCKRDLLQYYADVSQALLPHLADRAMVMKRYPNGIHGKNFFMKRTPPGAPAWLRTCPIEHRSGSVINFPVIDDLASLLWVVNLGCIDLNPWYSRCEDTDRPDFLNFDLDPVPPATFADVRLAALRIRDELDALGARPYAKTSGSKGIHIYVPLEFGPAQKQVWRFSKAIAVRLANSFPDLLTAEFRVANRPPGRVLVDYNQNAWGRTLASVYSVRPRTAATVSMPVTWDELEDGINLEDLHLRNVPARIAQVGDLWRPLLYKRGRFDVSAHF
jgi:bifunctional non-homologous end joining protein LigD